MTVLTEPVCKCGEHNPSMFSKESKSRNGYRSQCKNCDRAYSSRPSVKARQKKYDQNYRSDEKNRLAERRAQLKRVYGLTLEQYDSLLEDQGGVCAICGKPETRVVNDRVINLAVDHCHRTGSNRGLLCYNCNNGLGRFLDNKDLLLSAVKYMDKYDLIKEEVEVVS